MGSLEELQEVARSILSGIKPRKRGATVFALSGDLGSGKTAFVKIAGKYFGIKETITSPTFLILKSYKLVANSFKLLHHIDAYRLEKGEELMRLRFGELLNDPKNIIFIEWSEHVANVVPKYAKQISFLFIDELTRQIEV
ncbi:MAG: tRNA (adenosine(37)-N6)-threonylcarbamoyltransferase complex ATPase subunit type 1 TsaE [Candidatus Taylorbacteria bacterium]